METFRIAVNDIEFEFGCDSHDKKTDMLYKFCRENNIEPMQLVLSTATLLGDVASGERLNLLNATGLFMQGYRMASDDRDLSGELAGCQCPECITKRTMESNQT